MRNDMSRVQQTQDSSVHIHTGGPDASTTRQSTNQSSSLKVSVSLCLLHVRQVTHSYGPQSTSSNSPSNKAARVLRTVYLPSERADALLLTVQSLQQQLADLQRVHAEKADVSSLNPTAHPLPISPPAAPHPCSPHQHKASPTITYLASLAADTNGPQAWRRDRDEREAAFRRKAEADSAHITTLEEQLKTQQDKTKYAMRGT